MKIQKRKVNSSNHTKSLKMGGRWYSRKEAVKMAKQGRVDGVTVCKGGNDEYYLRSLPGHTNLYDLPVQIV